VFTSRIVNNTADPIRRGTVAMMLDYKTDLAGLMPLLREAVQGAAGVLERPVNVRIEDLASEGVRLSVGFWTDSRRSDFQDTSSEVRLVVIGALRSAGVAMPEAEVWRVDQQNVPDGSSSTRLD